LKEVPVKKPKLNSTLIVKDNPNEAALEGTRIFTRTAVDSVSERGRFTVVLSGGSTPRLMHHLLAEEPFLSEIPWKKTHIFWADERCVPEDHPLSNFGAAKQDFITAIPIPESHIYPMPAQSSSEKGAAEYQQRLSDIFGLAIGEIPRFDLVFLGIGSDGHIASLFPNHWALEEKERLVVWVKGGDPDVYRLTMTLPVFNNARAVVFLISGRHKSDVLRAVFEDTGDRFPANRVHPTNGVLIWLTDQEAASCISSNMTNGKF